MAEKSVDIDDNKVEVVPIHIFIEIDGIMSEWNLYSKKKTIHVLSELSRIISSVLARWDEIPFTED